jgi:hypothetical protein
MTDLNTQGQVISKEQIRLVLYSAFHDWFMESGCDFWNECNAPDELASIAVDRMFGSTE